MHSSGDDATSAAASPWKDLVRTALLPLAEQVSTGETGRDHLDLIGDSADPGYPGDVTEGDVALVLVLDLTLEGQPAGVDVNLDLFGGKLGIQHQDLERRPTDLVVPVTVPQVDLELILDRSHAAHRFGDPYRRVT